MRRFWLIPLLLALALLSPGPAGAHPADRLLQHLIVTVHADRIEATFAIGGGFLATNDLAVSIDLDGDRAFSEVEASHWLDQYLDQISIVRDGQPVPLGAASVRLEVPSYSHFSLAMSPILVTITIPGDGVQTALPLTISTNYRPDLSDLRVDVAETAGGTLVGPVYAGRTTHLTVALDPSVPATNANSDDVARSWSAGGVVTEARALFERPKTPWFIVAMLGIFAGMGALHAIQPGHGKTLVAAYLVATGGTPRDAMTLAGVVTATHTLSVFLLGSLTLLASQWFLPSRVIPVLSVVSGLLVAGLGAMMLWKALRRWRRPEIRNHDLHHEFPHHQTDSHRHDHAHDHHHAHDHDHATLSDDEHARLHAQEIDQVFVEHDGKRRVSFRQLAVLGVSGGIAPCPDALAILLLSAGIGQAAFGMVAIVAFSAGLAAVLVAFGVGVALLGPLIGRLLNRQSQDRGFAGRALDRLVVVSPVMSALVVLGLGVAMLVTIGR
jgi:ABC-type nickel/cobalt efflux system permease component RcnA